MQNPVVSIITPTYNHESYISQCIHSVLDQSFKDWEMIIIDDGSSDQTLKIIQKFSQQDNRIRVYTQKNVGIFRLAENYNKALNLSQGKYIAVLEGDDVWVKDKLKIQVESMEANPDAVLSWGQAYSSKYDLSSNYALHPTSSLDSCYMTNTPIGCSLNEFIFRNFIPALTVMVRKDALFSIGGFKQKFHLPLVDLPTWEELSVKGLFLFINQPLGSWRIYPTQVTKTYTTDIFEGFFLLAQDIYLRYPQIIEIPIQRIQSHYKKMRVVIYSRSGRYKLIRKDFKGARQDYYISIYSGGFVNITWKIRSVIGIIFSYFHCNVEYLAKMLGKDYYIYK